MIPESNKRTKKIFNRLHQTSSAYTRFFEDKQDLYGHIDHDRAERLISEAVEEKYERDCAAQLNNPRYPSRDEPSWEKEIRLELLSQRPPRYALYFTFELQSAYNPAWGGCAAWKAQPGRIDILFCDYRTVGDFIDVNRVEFYETGAPRKIDIPARVMDVVAIQAQPLFKWRIRKNKLILKEKAI